MTALRAQVAVLTVCVCSRSLVKRLTFGEGSRVSWIHSRDSPRRKRQVLCVDGLVCDTLIRTSGF